MLLRCLCCLLSTTIPVINANASNGSSNESIQERNPTTQTAGTNTSTLEQSSTKLSEEAAAEDVRTIKYVQNLKTRTFEKTLEYEDTTGYFTTQPTETLSQLLGMNSCTQYKNTESIVFENMNFSQNDIQALEVSGIYQLHIKDIIFNNCSGIYDNSEGLVRLLSGGKQLRSLALTLSDKELSFPQAFINGVKEKCSELNLLCFRVPSLTIDDAKNIAELLTKTNKHIKTLYMTIKKAEKGALSIISKALTEADQLESIAVSFGNIPCDDVKAFFENSSIKKLRTAKIDLDMNLYDNSGIFTAAGALSLFLSQQTNLTELDISGCNLSDASIEKIFKDGLINKPELKILKLNFIKNITKAAAEILAASIEPLKLNEFSAIGCDLSQETAGQIISALSKQQNLKMVNLDGNKITDIGEIINNCHNMISLSLQSCKIEKDVILKNIENFPYDNRKHQLLLNIKNNELNQTSIREIFNAYTKHLVNKPDSLVKLYIIV